MQELTTKQQEIVEFILKRQRMEGVTPSQQEIMEEFSFASSNSVRQHLRLIRQKGFLESDSGKVRSLRVTSPLMKLKRQLADIPLFGSIPAGVPVDHEQEADGCVSADVTTLGFKPTRNTFALRVVGDSMIGKHICNGDIVIVEFGADPLNGQVVAAFVDGRSTLKTFLIKNGKPILRAENPKYKDIIPAEGLTIQGVLKGLIRNAID